MEAHGYGALLATASETDAQIAKLMSTMKEMTATPLSSYSQEWKPLPQQLVEIEND